LNFQVTEVRQIETYKFTAICPQCHTSSLFNPIGPDYVIGNEIITGQRLCTVETCKGHLFFAIRKGEILALYPPSPIDFKSENIPNAVKATFEEALNCQASHFYISSAIMIRRTLEEICEERNATGKDLKERIKNLSTLIILPKELIDGMDDLRLLGNDAAHIEAKTYAQITNEELLIAIDFTKEILKAIYQYKILLEKLKSLKKP
jgi:hypothetical protein